MNERKVGTVRVWNDRGYGFIQETFKKRYFFHITEFDSNDLPVFGQFVSFEVGPPRKEDALPCAVNVRPEPTLETVEAEQGGGL